MSLITYNGNCHCGAFRYRFKHPEITATSQCNCSYCSKQGWAYISPTEFEILRGGLKEYKFGTKSNSFQFCETCGVPVMVQGQDFVSVNARTIMGLDIWKLDIQWQYWNSTKTTYEPPSPPNHSLVPEEGEKIYTGGCHCGDVKIAVRTKPLPEVLVKECNCSICIRKALIHFYPQVGLVGKAPEIEVSGEEHLTTYSWSRKYAGHRFCKTCGVQVNSVMYGPPKEIVEKLEGVKLEKYKEFMSMCAVNIRVLDNVEWAGNVGEYVQGEGRVKVERDSEEFGEPYVLGP